MIKSIILATPSTWHYFVMFFFGQFFTTPPHISPGGILVGWPFKIPKLVGSIPTVAIPIPDQPPSYFFDIFLFPYQKQKLVVTLKIGKNINIITKVKVWWDFGGMNIQVDKYNIITEGKLLINLRITFQNAIWMGYVQMIVISHGGGIRPNNYNIYRDSQPKVIT